MVEDQDQLRRMAVKVLRDHGYRVIEASNPGEALLHCERYPGPIHLLLSDVVMPGMTGLEIVERIRPLRPSIEVLFMSGYSEQALQRHRDPELAGGYLQKPFSAEALATRVRRGWARGGARAPSWWWTMSRRSGTWCGKSWQASATRCWRPATAARRFGSSRRAIAISI